MFTAPPPPVKPDTMSTAGSLLHDGDVLRSSSRRMDWKEMSSEACTLAADSSGILLRKEALGNDDIEVDSQSRR